MDTNTIIIVILLSCFSIIFYLLYAISIKLRNLFWDTTTRINNIDKSSEILTKKLDIISNEIQIKSAETQNSIYLSQLDFKIPVFLGEWSIDTFLGKYIVQLIINSRPQTIVELGAGSSTQIIAKTLQLLEPHNHTHIAVDHDRNYLEISKRHAQLNDLADKVIWLECPLTTFEEYQKVWYGGLVEKINENKIDLLIIDGPPGNIQKHSRYPALPALLPLLNDNCVIILDDAARADEQEIAQMWLNENPEFSLTFNLDGHGIAILSRSSNNPQ